MASGTDVREDREQAWNRFESTDKYKEFSSKYKDYTALSGYMMKDKWKEKEYNTYTTADFEKAYNYYTDKANAYKGGSSGDSYVNFKIKVYYENFVRAANYYKGVWEKSKERDRINAQNSAGSGIDTNKQPDKPKEEAKPKPPAVTQDGSSAGSGIDYNKKSKKVSTPSGSGVGGTYRRAKKRSYTSNYTGMNYI